MINDFGKPSETMGRKAMGAKVFRRHVSPAAGYLCIRAIFEKKGNTFMLLQKNHLRRNLALLVMLAFVLSLLPLPALAEGETTESHYHSFACYV